MAPEPTTLAFDASGQYMPAEDINGLEFHVGPDGTHVTISVQRSPLNPREILLTGLGRYGDALSVAPSGKNEVTIRMD